MRSSCRVCAGRMWKCERGGQCPLRKAVRQRAGETAEQTEEDAETGEGAEAEGQDTGEINEYGLTDAQQEALLASVKESVTTEYLEKYNIAPADFELLPYDANDLNNYDASNTYTGTDPYESASVWNVVDDVIGKTQNWELRALSMGMDTEDDLEFAADFIESPELVFAGTLEEQNALNKETTGGAFVLDTSTQKYALENALYMGIAEFLNGLSDTARAGTGKSVCADPWAGAGGYGKRIFCTGGSSV